MMKSVDDMLAEGFSLPNAVEERSNMIREATQQERYWAYSQDAAALLAWKDRVLERYALATQDIGGDPDAHETVTVLADRVRETLRFIATYQDLINETKMAICREHGEMKVLDPELIERAFDPGVKPLWGEGADE